MWMSSSDARMFEELAERVAALEAGQAEIERRLAALLPRDVSPELYGPEPDHAADREARAALLAKRRDRGTRYALGAAPEDQVP
jgi:hypothetical protein